MKGRIPITLSEEQLNTLYSDITKSVDDSELMQLFTNLDSTADVEDYEVYVDTYIDGLGYCDVYVGMDIHLEREGQYRDYGDHWNPPMSEDGHMTCIEYTVRNIEIVAPRDDYNVKNIKTKKVTVL